MTGAKRLAAAALIAGIAGAAWAAGPFAAIGQMQHGRWELKAIGGSEVRALCVDNPLRLVQLNHPGPACPHYVIEDAADHVTIQYVCGPRGYGKTTIKVGQPGQIRLDTQGIAPGGRPFDASYEGRFAGPCAPPPPR